MIRNDYSILLVGVGGQGVLLASEIISEVAMQHGFDVKKSEVHGYPDVTPEKIFVRICNNDIFVCLEPGQSNRCSPAQLRIWFLRQRQMQNGAD